MTSMDDIIFDERNKAYGAYALRQVNDRVVTISILVSSFFFCLIVLAIFYHYLILQDALYTMGGHAGGKGETSIVINTFQNSGPPPQYIPEEERNTIPVVVDSSRIAASQKNVLYNDATGDTVGRGNGNGNGSGNGSGDGNVYLFAEQAPSYPGGEKERMTFLQRNIMYPAEARNKKVQGTIYVSFIVERNGRLSNIKILKGIGYGCDEEAIRVLKLMPPWNPGMQNGNTVRVQLVIPLVFTLSVKN